jgi:membrane-associated protein
MFDSLIQFVSDASGWAYAAVFLIALLDALVPIVPSETVVITAGVVAGVGDLNLGIVIGAAAAGAMAGDNTAYLIGHHYGARLTSRLAGRARALERLAWAERQLSERGGELIAVGRFIPGGRTAVTLSSGTLRFPWRRFVVYDAAAALGWALYAALLGFFGGEAFKEAPWKGLLLAVGIAFSLTSAIEVVRWYRRRVAAG